MKVLFHRYNSICEPDYIEAFRALGLEVIEDREEMEQKNIGIEQRVASLGEQILTQQPLFVFSINFYPYISMVCEKLKTKYVCISVDCPVQELYSVQIRNACNRVFLFDQRQYLDVVNENPDGIFSMPLGADVARLDELLGVMDPEEKKTYRYDISFVGSLYSEKNPFADAYTRLSDHTKGVYDALLRIQSQFGGLELLESALPDEQVLELIRKEYEAGCLGADEIQIPGKEGINDIKEAVDSSDISSLWIRDLKRYIVVNRYLGAELTERDRLELLRTLGSALDGIAEVHLFTRSDITPLKTAGAALRFHGGVRSLDEMPRVFRTSKININPTMRSIQNGLPQRIWDVLGSGGFLLTSYCDELPEYFEIGTHLAAYETPMEAAELTAYYLTHDEEREQIAQAGYELVKAKHTVLARAAQMVKACLS